jgi:hypothetical protein
MAIAHESRRAFLLGLSSGPVGPFIVLLKRELVGGSVDDLRELLHWKAHGATWLDDLDPTWR